MTSNPAAVLDACVLYSATLRDLLMRLAVGFVFQPKWTDRIHDEWIRNVLANRPDLTREQIDRTRALMNTWGRDWQVPAVDNLAESLSLPDPDDRHVLAAAIASRAATIVTFNLRDFPDEVLAVHDVRAVHPDEFLQERLDAMPEAFLTAVRVHRAALRNPAKTPDEYLSTLAAHGLQETAQRLSDFRDEI